MLLILGNNPSILCTGNNNSSSLFNDSNSNIGCMDDGYQQWSPYYGSPACNYDSSAIVDDGSCAYVDCCGFYPPDCSEFTYLNSSIVCENTNGDIINDYISGGIFQCSKGGVTYETKEECNINGGVWYKDGIDICGVCGGNGSTCPEDCAGIVDGPAYINECDICIGGNDNIDDLISINIESSYFKGDTINIENGKSNQIIPVEARKLGLITSLDIEFDYDSLYLDITDIYIGTKFNINNYKFTDFTSAIEGTKKRTKLTIYYSPPDIDCTHNNIEDDCDLDVHCKWVVEEYVGACKLDQFSNNCLEDCYSVVNENINDCDNIFKIKLNTSFDSFYWNKSTSLELNKLVINENTINIDKVWDIFLYDPEGCFDDGNQGWSHNEVTINNVEIPFGNPACNHDEDVNPFLSNSEEECEYPGQEGTVWEDYCDCNDNVLDECNKCGGGQFDGDTNGDNLLCDPECDVTITFDKAGTNGMQLTIKDNAGTVKIYEGSASSGIGNGEIINTDKVGFIIGSNPTATGYNFLTALAHANGHNGTVTGFNTTGTVTITFVTGQVVAETLDNLNDMTIAEIVADCNNECGGPDGIPDNDDEAYYDKNWSVGGSGDSYNCNMEGNCEDTDGNILDEDLNLDNKEDCLEYGAIWNPDEASGENCYCVGGSTGISESVEDCLGEWSGDAYYDNLENCIEYNDTSIYYPGNIDVFKASFKIYNESLNEITNSTIKKGDSIFYVVSYMENFPDYSIDDGRILEGMILKIDSPPSSLMRFKEAIINNELYPDINLPLELNNLSYTVDDFSLNPNLSDGDYLFSIYSENDYYEGQEANSGNILLMEFESLGSNGDIAVLNYNEIQVNEHVMKDTNYTPKEILFGDCNGDYLGAAELDDCDVCNGNNINMDVCGECFPSIENACFNFPENLIETWMLTEHKMYENGDCTGEKNTVTFSGGLVEIGDPTGCGWFDEDDCTDDNTYQMCFWDVEEGDCVNNFDIKSIFFENQIKLNTSGTSEQLSKIIVNTIFDITETTTTDIMNTTVVNEVYTDTDSINIGNWWPYGGQVTLINLAANELTIIHDDSSGFAYNRTDKTGQADRAFQIKFDVIAITGTCYLTVLQAEGYSWNTLDAITTTGTKTFESYNLHNTYIDFGLKVDYGASITIDNFSIQRADGITTEAGTTITQTTITDTTITYTTVEDEPIIDQWGIFDEESESLFCLFRDDNDQLDCKSYDVDGNTLIITFADEEFDKCSKKTFQTKSSLSNFSYVMPSEYALFQNYPNPFNPSTNIRYRVPSFEYVTIDIINIRGQTIKNLIQQLHPPGNYKIMWNGTDNYGLSVSSGIYFYRMNAPSFQSVHKLVKIK